jgi:hypothetical protein
MKERQRTRVIDPRNEKAVYANTPVSVFAHGYNLHAALGVERPADEEAFGPDMKLVCEIVSRLVMPLDAAYALADAINKTRGVAKPGVPNPPQH